MAIWFLVILAVTLFGVRGRRQGFYDDFLSIEQCQAINGVAIMVVLARHAGHLGLMPCGYAMDGWGDSLYFLISNPLQQLLVVTFLFFSGYGVMEQFTRKGEAYLDGFAKKRLFPVWANFAVAVAGYVAVHLAFQTGQPTWKLLMAFTSFEAIGNPNWYIFCILWCYAGAGLAFLAVRYLHLDARKAWLVSLLASVVYFVWLHSLEQNRFWWTDTVLSFPFGMFVSVHREKMVAFAKRHYGACLAVSLILFAALICIDQDIYNVRGTAWKTASRARLCVCCIRHNVLSCVTMVAIMLATMKVKIGNSALVWLGRHVFPIYIYHLLFFLIVKNAYHGAIPFWGAQLIVAGVVALTLLTAKFYPRWEIRLK